MADVGDHTGEVGRQAGVRHPFNLAADEPDLQISLVVRVDGHRLVVPRVMVDFDVEANARITEIGVNHSPVEERHGWMANEAPQADTMERIEQPHLVVRLCSRTHW